MFIDYFVPGKGTKYCDEYFMSVCPFKQYCKCKEQYKRTSIGFIMQTHADRRSVRGPTVWSVSK